MVNCNGCGCTDKRACPGGCVWVYRSASFNICSSCAGTEADLYATLARIEKASGITHLPEDEIRLLAKRAQKRYRDRRAALRHPAKHKAYLKKYGSHPHG